jgi:hypothetical protein
MQDFFANLFAKASAAIRPSTGPLGPLPPRNAPDNDVAIFRLGFSSTILHERRRTLESLVDYVARNGGVTPFGNNGDETAYPLQELEQVTL